MYGHRYAFFKTKGKHRCPKCDLFGCICQTGLIEFGVEIVKPLKDLTHNQKVALCPQGCLNSSIACLEYYDFDKFKGVVSI